MSNERIVYVCPHCGWWKAERFDCRHMVDAVDGEPAFRDYPSQRLHFELPYDPSKAVEIHGA